MEKKYEEITIRVPEDIMKDWRKHCKTFKTDWNVDIVIALADHIEHYSSEPPVETFYLLELKEEIGMIIDKLVDKGFNFYSDEFQPKDVNDVINRLLQIADGEGYIDLDDLNEEIDEDKKNNKHKANHPL